MNNSIRLTAVHAPIRIAVPVPALLWIHGGGFIIGRPEQDEINNIAVARELNIVVAAVAYRLGA